MFTRLSGGLGNQMFQFAAAKVLEKNKKNTSVIIDESYYVRQPKKDTYREVELFQYNVHYSRKSNKIEQLAIKLKVFILKSINFLPLALRRIFKSKICETLGIRDDSNFENNFQSKDNTCLIGYFQKASFYKGSEELLRKEFELCADLKKKILQLDAYNYINKNDNTISVHIRRGDYVLNEHANKYHGLCDMEYYKRALSYFHSHTNNPKFVFFSDDYDWMVKEFSWVENAYFVDGSLSVFSSIDISLMSLCSHNIIANSTFSWWGAWLNPNPNKVVICPEYWTVNRTVSELYVEGWIKL